MVDVDVDGPAGREQDVYLRVTIANHVFMVIMHFMERAWPWSKNRLECMPNFDLQMVESRRGVLFPLLPGAVDGVRRGSVRCILSRTRYSPVRALLAVLCTISICGSRANVGGWYSYDFPTGDVYPVLARRTKHEGTCLVSELRPELVR